MVVCFWECSHTTKQKQTIRRANTIPEEGFPTGKHGNDDFPSYLKNSLTNRWAKYLGKGANVQFLGYVLFLNSLPEQTPLVNFNNFYHYIYINLIARA